MSLCPPRPCPHGPAEDPSAVPVWVFGCRPSHSGVPPAPPSPGAPPGHPRFWGQRLRPPSRRLQGCWERTGEHRRRGGLGRAGFIHRKATRRGARGRQVPLPFAVLHHRGPGGGGTKPSPGPPQLRSRRGRCWARGAAMLSPPRDPPSRTDPGHPWGPRGAGCPGRSQGGAAPPGIPFSGSVALCRHCRGVTRKRTLAARDEDGAGGGAGPPGGAAGSPAGPGAGSAGCSVPLGAGSPRPY